MFCRFLCYGVAWCYDEMFHISFTLISAECTLCYYYSLYFLTVFNFLFDDDDDVEDDDDNDDDALWL